MHHLMRDSPVGCTLNNNDFMLWYPDRKRPPTIESDFSRLREVHLIEVSEKVATTFHARPNSAEGFYIGIRRPAFKSNSSRSSGVSACSQHNQAYDESFQGVSSAVPDIDDTPFPLVTPI